MQNTQASPSARDSLYELCRATTAYHEAPPESIEGARLRYEEALRRFNADSAAAPSSE